MKFVRLGFGQLAGGCHVTARNEIHWQPHTTCIGGVAGSMFGFVGSDDPRSTAMLKMQVVLRDLFV